MRGSLRNMTILSQRIEPKIYVLNFYPYSQAMITKSKMKYTPRLQALPTMEIYSNKCCQAFSLTLASIFLLLGSLLTGLVFSHSSKGNNISYLGPSLLAIGAVLLTVSIIKSFSNFFNKSNLTKEPVTDLLKVQRITFPRKFTIEELSKKIKLFRLRYKVE